MWKHPLSLLTRNMTAMLGQGHAVPELNYIRRICIEDYKQTYERGKPKPVLWKTTRIFDNNFGTEKLYNEETQIRIDWR